MRSRLDQFLSDCLPLLEDMDLFLKFLEEYDDKLDYEKSDIEVLFKLNVLTLAAYDAGKLDGMEYALEEAIELL